MTTGDLRNDSVRLQRFLNDARLLVSRPTPSPTRPRNHFDTAHRRHIRLDHKLKSRHKPISQSGKQTRPNDAQIEGGDRTALTV